MNLTIDIGNTNVKVGFFELNQLIKVINTNKENFETKIIQKHNIIFENIIISDVSGWWNKNKLLKTNNIIQLDSNLKIPIKISYASRNTLGKDRIALAVGASKLFPQSNVLVIDAGTCITYDFINNKKEYLGGSISPGLQMRCKSLHHYTEKLPIIKTLNWDVSMPSNSTSNCIQTGVMYGVVYEILGIISEYKKNVSSLKIILTGGDTNFLMYKLKKNSIFANINLLHIGLNEIIQFNVQKK